MIKKKQHHSSQIFFCVVAKKTTKDHIEVQLPKLKHYYTRIINKTVLFFKYVIHPIS